MIGVVTALFFCPQAVIAAGDSAAWSFSGDKPSSTAYWSNATTLQQIRAAAETTEHGEKSEEQAKTVSPIEVGLEDKSTSWHAETPVKKTGETKVFEKRHLFRTHAGGMVSDNIHMSLGPEMLFREKQGAKEGIADSSEPEATLGFGMRWQVEF